MCVGNGLPPVSAHPYIIANDMKKIEKYLLFIVSLLALMVLAGVIVYTAMSSRMSLLLGAVLILVTGFGFGTLIYHGYDIDKE